METVKFDASLHLKEIQEWAEARGLGMVPLHLLPKNGRVVPGVCAAFLYLTDSQVGFLENLISNPFAERSVASEGLDACLLAIEKDAKENSVSLLWSSTCIASVMKRAHKLGFQVQQRVYKLIIKGI